MRRYLMTWVPAVARWVKRYRGGYYVVSCAALNAPKSKEGSWRQANEWWLRKQAELDASNPPPKPGHPHQEALNQVDEKLDWAASYAPGEVPQLQDARQEIAATIVQQDPPPEDHVTLPGDGSIVSNNIREFERATGIVLPDSVYNQPEILSKFFGNARLWEDRLTRQPVNQQLPESTLGTHGKLWLEKMQLRHAKQPGTFQNLKTHLGAFLDCPQVTTSRMPITAINETLMESYFVAIARQKDKGEISDDTAKNRLIVARRFVRHLWGLRLIELPRNLDSQDLRVRVVTKKIKIPALQSVKACLSQVEGILRLCILLMLNCGMYQTDIADLLSEEVDWQEGRITRKRSKTKDNANVPTVSYKLWPETFALLQRYQSGQERVLLSERGTPLVVRMMKGDKAGKKDLVQLAWKRWNKNRRLPIQLKQFRKIGASLLESNNDYARFAAHYLGHSPRSLADKHYVVPSAQQFDKALEWLGQQLLGESERG